MSSSCVRFVCPNLQCRTVLAVPVTARGKVVRCRSCSIRVQVPTGMSEPKPAVKPEANPAGDAR